MGRYYKNELHGPIQDYAYELPFTELFTMQKYKRAESEKADKALQAGYDKILNLNYKPGDEAKVAQLRKNFSNLTDNVYKKYGNNLANATSSINQGINEVMDAGLMSDINANYKTWTANEASKAALHKTGQFQPNFEVDWQGARPTEDAQGRRRDYAQYLASHNMRPNQEAIYNNIPEDERTQARLEQSAARSAYQYAMSNPQHLIQRYGQDIVPLIQAAQLGDTNAQKEINSRSYKMLLETLPEYVSTNATDDGSDPDSDGGDDSMYVANDFLDGMKRLELDQGWNLSNNAVAQAKGIDGTAAAKGEFSDNAIQITLGPGNTVLTPGVFANSNSGFVYNNGVYTYSDYDLNPQEAARQAAELQALDGYFETHKAQAEELGLRAQSTPLSEIGAVGPAGPVAPVGGVEGATGPTGPTGAEGADSDLGIIQPLQSVEEEYINPNLKRAALEELKKLGIDPDDPEVIELYRAYKEYKEKQTPDEKIREATAAMITAMQAQGMHVDFKAEDNPAGNSFISIGPDGQAVLNVRGVATVPTTRIDNTLTDESTYAGSEDGRFYLGRLFGGKDAWDHEGHLWADGPELTGPGRLFEKSGLGKVGDNKDGEQLYEFNMIHQIPINYETSEHFNRATAQGTATEANAQMGERKKMYDKWSNNNVLSAFQKSIQSQVNKQIPKYVQESGRGINRTFSLNSANFENTNVSSPNEYSLSAEGIETLNGSVAKGNQIFDMLQKDNPNTKIFKEVYNGLANELKEITVDNTDQDAVKDYGNKVKKFYEATEYLETGINQAIDGAQEVGNLFIKEGFKKLSDMTEDVFNTGVTNEKITNPGTLRELTKIKAHTLGLFEIKGLDMIKVSDQVFGPYASGNAHKVLQQFNALLLSNPSEGAATVTSAFRTDAYNSTLKGSEKDSDHLSGNAFDFTRNTASDYLYKMYTEGQLPEALRNNIRTFFLHSGPGVTPHYHLSLVTD